LDTEIARLQAAITSREVGYERAIEFFGTEKVSLRLENPEDLDVKRILRVVSKGKTIDMDIPKQVLLNFAAYSNSTFPV
jgi:hypothetical protein